MIQCHHERSLKYKKPVIPTCQYLLIKEIYTEKNVTIKACLENLIRNVFKEKY